MTEKKLFAHLLIPAQFGKPAMEFPIHTGVNIIGKSKGDIQIGHDFVSGIHASIEVFEDGSEHWIEDLESTNGTYFGESTVSLRPRRFYQLIHGKSIRLGRTIANYDIVGHVNEEEEAEMNITADKTAVLSKFALEGESGEKMSESENDEVMHTAQKEVDSPASPAPVEPNYPTLNDIMDMAKNIADSEDDDKASDVIVGTNDQSIEHHESTALVMESEANEKHSAIPDSMSLSGSIEQASPQFPTGKQLLGDALIDDSEPETPAASRENTASHKPSQSSTKSAIITLKPPSAPSSREPSVERPVVSVKEDEPSKRGRKKIYKKPEVPVEDISSVDLGEVLKPGMTSIPNALPPAKPAKKSRKKSDISVVSNDDSNVEQQSTKKSGRKLSHSSTVDDEMVIDNPVEPVKKGGRRKRSADTEVSIRSTKQIKSTSVESSAKSNVRILFTTLDDADEKAAIMKKFGARIVESWKDCTHLVTAGIKRTTKFLCALSSGKQIISAEWVRACQKSKELIDASSFNLKDKEGEKKWKMRLQESLDTVQEKGPGSLFNGLSFLILPTTKPKYEDLAEMIEAGGGTVLTDLPLKHDDKVFVLGSVEDKDLIVHYQKAGWKNQILEPIFIVDSSLRQALVFDEHRYTGRHRK